MGKIVLLDDLTINQIAAGEVIERPSSVVKELTENSIDAGAKNITIDIKHGGISYIRITDDGCGIEPDDMEISFERHATSKIRQAADLETVKSMGFRGEALASVAAVAKVTMTSKTRENSTGYKIRIEGGDIIEKTEEGCPDGTSITIEELFYNTPVRYKFLKKDFTEAGYIEDQVTRIAIANPDVAIKLINSGKTVIQTRGTGKLTDVIYAIYGLETMENSLEVDYTYEDYKVTGVIGKPLIAKNNRAGQMFFVNNRFVKDKTLSAATEAAFKGLITVGKFGFAILNIEMDPKKVDVNVHPAKLEVRFQEENLVFKSIYHAIKETLLKASLISDRGDVQGEDKTLNEIFDNTIKSKEKVQTWSLQGTIENATKAAEEEAAFNLGKNKDEEPVEDKNFSNFKDTLEGVDEETRVSFIESITKAKTPEEIIAGLNKYTEMAVAKNKAAKKEQEEAESDKALETEEATEEEKVESAEAAEEVTEVTEEAVVEQAEEPVEETEEIIAAKERIEELSSMKQDEPIEEESDEVEEASKEDSVEENVSEEVSDEAEGVEAEDAEVEVKEEPAKVEEPKEEKELSFEEMYKKLFGRDVAAGQKEYEEKQKARDAEYASIQPVGENESLFDDEEPSKAVKKYKYIGIAFKTYIMFTKDDDLYFMDQHAAHEKVLFERIKANYNKDEEKDSQLMLLPDVITLTDRQMGSYEDNKELFEKAGFMCDEFGDNVVKLSGVPSFCMEQDTKQLFIDTLDEINTVARTNKDEVEYKFLATVACKAAVKAGMTLSQAQVEDLMRQLLECENPYNCPHGRPTIIKISRADLEKKFSRRL